MCWMFTIPLLSGKLPEDRHPLQSGLPLKNAKNTSTLDSAHIDQRPRKTLKGKRRPDRKSPEAGSISPHFTSGDLVECTYGGTDKERNFHHRTRRDGSSETGFRLQHWGESGFLHIFWASCRNPCQKNQKSRRKVISLLCPSYQPAVPLQAGSITAPDRSPASLMQPIFLLAIPELAKVAQLPHNSRLLPYFPRT